MIQPASSSVRAPSLIVALLLAVAVVAGPALARADDDGSERELAEGLTIGGLTVFASTYALTGLAATTLVLVANTRETTIAESWIPLVGPWIMLGDSTGFNDLQLGLLAASGVIQAVSLGVLIAGLVLQSRGDPPTTAASGPALRLEPLVSNDLLGLRLLGRF